MNSIISQSLTDLIPTYFYLVIFLIVFIETALVFAFFIPGDTLLFTSGLLIATTPALNIWISLFLISLAAFLGDQVSFLTGKSFGKPLFQRSVKLSTLLRKSENFYGKHGVWAILLARFYPWFRTLIPFLAGASRMNYLKFVTANMLSAIVWGCGITSLGYGANSLPVLNQFSHYIAMFFVILTFAITVRNIRAAKVRSGHQLLEIR